MGRGIQIYGHLIGDWAQNISIHDSWFHHNNRQALILGGGDGGSDYEFVRSAEIYNNIFSHSGWPENASWVTVVIGGISWGRYGGEFNVHNNIIDGSGLAYPSLQVTGYIDSLNLTSNIILAKPNAWDYYTYYPDTVPSTANGSNNLYYRLPAYEV